MGSPWSASSFRANPPVPCRVLHALNCRYLLQSGSLGVQESKASHHGLLQELHRNLCSGISSLSLFTDRDCPQSLSSHMFSAVSQSQCSVLLPLKHIITEVPPASLMGSYLASGRSSLEPVGTVSVYGGRGHSCSKALPVNPLTYTLYTKC